MALRTETKEIDGNVYFVSQLTPLKSAVLLTKVLKTLGPALKSIGGSGLKLSDLKGMAGDLEGGERDESKDGLALEMLASMFSEIDENRVESLIKSTLLNESVRQDGKPIENLDVSFESPLTMLKVVVLVLKVNFKGFFQKSGT